MLMIIFSLSIYINVKAGPQLQSGYCRRRPTNDNEATANNFLLKDSAFLYPLTLNSSAKLEKILYLCNRKKAKFLLKLYFCKPL